MIIILGHYPNKKNEKDGMVRRISAIDSILGNLDKVYIEKLNKKLSITKMLKHPIRFYKALKNKNFLLPNNKTTVYKELYANSFYQMAKNANAIYVHSLYFLKQIPIEYIKKFGEKIILDIHGCVVEELIFNQEKEKTISCFKKYESIAFQYIGCFVAVSENMINFYKKKYEQNTKKFILLPIFNFNENKINRDNNSKKLRIIYSGGLQKWQNVSEMVHIVKQCLGKFKFIFLIHDIDEFSKYLKVSDQNDVLIKSVSPSEIQNFYANADLGFLLRDKNIVNDVACPTKAIEYLDNGIIPIVLQPEIGDLDQLGYQYITKKDLLENKLPTCDEMERMRKVNYKIVNKLQEIHSIGVKSLLQHLEKLGE